MSAVYAIWKNVEDRNVNGVKELVGYFHGSCEDACRLVDRMNAEDPGTQRQMEYVGRIRYGYWKQEIDLITKANCLEYIEQ